MSYSIDIDSHRVDRMLERAKEFMADGISESLIKVGVEAVADMKNLVSVHFPPASLPNEPPHMRTGNLQDRIDMKINFREVEVGVYGVPYAHALEYGYGPRNLLPRPFFWPTIFETAKRMPNLIVDDFREELKYGR